MHLIIKHKLVKICKLINKPSVRILIGKVRITSTGFMTILTNAIAIDAINAVAKLDIVIPGTIHPINIMINERASHFITKTIRKSPL